MIYIEIIGCGIFAISSIVLSVLLKKHPTDNFRITTTTVLHNIALLTLMLPIVIGIFYPGLTSYDKILGIPSLPYRSLALVIGVLLALISFFYIFTSCIWIFGQGQGAPGIELTKIMVDEFVYKTSRNPMSLGFYAGCLALGLLAGSTYFLLWTLIEIIPSHILYIKIFEELELEMRFGESYRNYKEHTPFLIPDIRKIVSKKLMGRNP